jgi:alpha,alpha-trehalose-phosphate synthase [UDP-forming]
MPDGFGPGSSGDSHTVLPGRSDLHVLAVSNRLPIVRGARGRWQRSSGGLVAALEPALRGRPATWLGWDGGGAVPERAAGIGVGLAGVKLSRSEVERYYHGFSNRALWPLLHGIVEHYVGDQTEWATYRAVNDRFARRAASLAGPGTLTWVHDYQLMLVPAALRGLGVGGPIAFFLHVPFPPPEVWARLPWGGQILRGVLGATLVGFQTERFRDNFARTAIGEGAARSWDGDQLMLHDGRVVQIAVHPISIDAAEVAQRATAPPAQRALGALRERFHGRTVLLGVDRLDYTKGIFERLLAFEALLERRPDLRRRLVLVQLAVPSRGDIREYRQARAALEALVGRINGRFTEPGGAAPIHYAHSSVPPDQLMAFYRLADVCLVTSLSDGMNLVAKEYVVAQAAGAGDGVLILSRFAGAADELGESALLCNPFHPDGVAGTIEMALALPADERARRIARMGRSVARDDVHAWVDRHLREARACADRPPAAVTGTSLSSDRAATFTIGPDVGGSAGARRSPRPARSRRP